MFALAVSSADMRSWVVLDFGFAASLASFSFRSFSLFSWACCCISLLVLNTLLKSTFGNVSFKNPVVLLLSALPASGLTSSSNLRRKVLFLITTDTCLGWTSTSISDVSINLGTSTSTTTLPSPSSSINLNWYLPSLHCRISRFSFSCCASFSLALATDSACSLTLSRSRGLISFSRSSFSFFSSAISKYISRLLSLV